MQCSSPAGKLKENGTHVIAVTSGKHERLLRDLRFHVNFLVCLAGLQIHISPRRKGIVEIKATSKPVRKMLAGYFFSKDRVLFLHCALEVRESQGDRISTIPARQQGNFQEDKRRSPPVPRDGDHLPGLTLFV
jgi:hypothetical protein